VREFFVNNDKVFRRLKKEFLWERNRGEVAYKTAALPIELGQPGKQIFFHITGLPVQPIQANERKFLDPEF
jgi:hypothetical protein